jgi:voltage-gated potassium channel
VCTTQIWNIPENSLVTHAIFTDKQTTLYLIYDGGLPTQQTPIPSTSSKAKDKARYLKKHPLEVVAVLFPFLRPLRLMRVISFGGLAIQKVAIGRQFAITIKVFIASIFIAYISAVQITITERAVEGSNIHNFGDGLWWAISTVTTVGYGDRYPTTTEGRFLAVVLMIMGISLVGVITASVAAWFVRMGQEDSRNEK